MKLNENDGVSMKEWFGIDISASDGDGDVKRTEKVVGVLKEFWTALFATGNGMWKFMLPRDLQRQDLTNTLDRMEASRAVSLSAEMRCRAVKNRLENEIGASSLCLLLTLGSEEQEAYVHWKETDGSTENRPARTLRRLLVGNVAVDMFMFALFLDYVCFSKSFSGNVDDDPSWVKLTKLMSTRQTTAIAPHLPSAYARSRVTEFVCRTVKSLFGTLLPPAGQSADLSDERLQNLLEGIIQLRKDLGEKGAVLGQLPRCMASSLQPHVKRHKCDRTNEIVGLLKRLILEYTPLQISKRRYTLTCTDICYTSVLAGLSIDTVRAIAFFEDSLLFNIFATLPRKVRTTARIVADYMADRGGARLLDSEYREGMDSPSENILSRTGWNELLTQFMSICGDIYKSGSHSHGDR